MSTTPETPQTPLPILVTLTKQNVIDLLDAAGYGIAYWANSAKVDEEAKTYTVISEDLEEDGPALTRVISFERISTAFNQLAVEKKFPDWQMAEIAEKDLAFDAMTADMTVQLALFGEIVYG